MKRFWTKATIRETGSPRRSANWVAARRAWFKIFEDRFECGDWVIPLDAVEKAILYTGRQFFMPVSVLELQTAAQTYQFGFNPWVKLERHLIMDFEKQTVRFGYSAFSVVIRIILAGYLIFLVWRWIL